MKREATPTERRAVWESKPVLRVVYRDLFARIASACLEGMTVEVGGGTGAMRELIPHAVSSDIVLGPGLDLIADGQLLPLRDGSITNLVALDTLHHLGSCPQFFAEAERVVHRGGRLILIEPAISPISWIFYRFLHPEPVELNADPLTGTQPYRRGTSPSSADMAHCNQAIATLLTRRRHKERFARRYVGLRLSRSDWISLWAYPLSGGFQRWSLLPQSIANRVLEIERKLEPLLGRVFGFRMILVWDRV